MPQTQPLDPRDRRSGQPRRPEDSTPAAGPARPAFPADLEIDLSVIFGAPRAGEWVARVQDGGPEGGLSEMLGMFERSLDEQLGRGMCETRYRLGLEYRAAGLLDEAIEVLGLAARDDCRVFECSRVIGLCFMDKGAPEKAVGWFEAAMARSGRAPEEYAALRYALALAHEAMGEVDKAVDLYTGIYRREPEDGGTPSR